MASCMLPTTRMGARKALVSGVRLSVRCQHEHALSVGILLVYLSLGFREFECIPDLWDAANPCQIYVMAL